MNENTARKEVDGQLIQWLDARNPRLVAWAAYYALRDRQKKAVPAILSYVHVQAFDPAFQMNSDPNRRVWPEVRDAADPMLAVLDALIQLHVVVPADDLLQIAPVLPTQALVMSILPKPQETVLYQIYLNGGFGSGRRHFEPQSDTDADNGNLKWLMAGNLLADQGYEPFVHRVFNSFALTLNFSVARADGPLTGSGIFPACSVTESQAKRDNNWPSIGNYGLSAAAPSAKYRLGRDEIPDTQILATAVGAPNVFLERYLSRAYGSSLECGFSNYSPSQIEAHWLEAMGIGTVPKIELSGAWRMAGVVLPGGVAENQRFFSFARLFKVKDDNEYRDQLQKWLAVQHLVYTNVVTGLREQHLITEDEARRPLQIRIHGLDLRTSSGRLQSITDPPFPDLTPPDTNVTWVSGS
jgi:hypothetical protein